jgi:hypothetical protein
MKFIKNRNLPSLANFFDLLQNNRILLAILLIDLVSVFVVLRYVLHVSLSFMIKTDDAYYTRAVLQNFGVFRQGAGWMNFVFVKWYGLFPLGWHPYIGILFRTLHYLAALFLIKRFICKSEFERKLVYIVFMFPLLFYFIFKPAPEIFMLPLLILMIYQLAYDKIHKPREYFLFFAAFFIISQMKPVLVTLVFFAVYRLLRIKRFIFSAVLLAFLFGNYWLYKACSDSPVNTYCDMPELSVIIANGLRQKEIFTDLVHGKADLNNPDYRAKIMRDRSWIQMMDIVQKTGNTNKGVILYLVKHPDLILFQIGMNFLMIFGGMGRMWLMLLLCAINIPVFVITFVLTRKQDRQRFLILLYCMAYLLFFLVLNAMFRYTYAILPLVYFLFALSVYKFITDRKSKLAYQHE